MEEFSRYWTEKHAALALQLVPEIRRYVQNHAIKLDVGEEPRFDGMAELWFDDLRDWQKFADFYRSNAGKVIRDDNEKFIDRSKMVLLVTEERVMKP